MAGLLNTAYVVLVLLVAIGGVGFVFTTTGRNRGWQQWLVVAFVAVFVIVMGGALVM